jgi:predicted transposase YdaD
MAASGILAGLKLEEAVIYRLLQRDIMQESTVYRSILAEGETKGEERKQREIATNSLTLLSHSRSVKIELKLET